MDLLTGLTAIKQTLDITKELRNIDGKINVAEFKLRLADMVGRLLEAQEALQDARERERDLQHEIRGLKEALIKRGKLIDENGFLFELDTDGAKVGQPFCNLCHVRENKQFRMRHFHANTSYGESYWCDNCKTRIEIGPKKEVHIPSRGGFRA